MSTETKLTSLAHINTLWELLELALGDLEKAEKAEGVVVDMSYWYAPEHHGKCLVCMAGAVMRESLSLPSDFSITDEEYEVCEIEPWEYDRETAGRLCAVNDLRTGDVTAAWYQIYTNQAKAPFGFDRRVANYSNNRDQWWSDMRKLLEDLKAANL